MKGRSRWRFETLGEPYHWWLTADSMKDASELIFAAIDQAARKPSAHDLELARKGYELAHPSHDRRSAYVLLVGFSLENLLKAEYVRLNEGCVTEGRLPEELREHDLLRLCALTGLAPRPEEHDMLRVASQATISWGRYPGGLRHDKGGTSPPECFDLEEFKRVFEAVYWRLTAIITKDWE